MKSLFRWTEVQLPLLKQGAPTNLRVERSLALVLTQTLKPYSFCVLYLTTKVVP